MSAGYPLIKVEDWSPDDRRHALAAFWRKMGPVILNAVMISFDKAKMISPTQREIRRRTEMAKELVNEMVALRWSTPRVRDILGLVLDSKLLGLELNLETMGARSVW